MSLLRFCEWLAATPWSIALHESRYMYLGVLTVHVLTLCVLVGITAMLDLRLLGLTMRHVPASEVLTRLLPWAVAGFVVMIASGALLFYADPVMKYRNIFFRLKMLTLGLAVLNAWVFHRWTYRDVAHWDLDPFPPRGVRMAAGVSLGLWAVMITLGRLIPYQVYWFDCGRPANSAIVKLVILLMGC
jgi:uncharacterized protein DUF6644